MYTCQRGSVSSNLTTGVLLVMCLAATASALRRRHHHLMDRQQAYLVELLRGCPRRAAMLVYVGPCLQV
jgi:hypothetical protein